MAKYRRSNQTTPNGDAYSEIYYFDNAGESVDETVATRCVIRKCDHEGNLFREI